jgi:glutathione S-transferase
MKLYQNPYSQHSRRVVVLAAELGLELELINVDVRPKGWGGENERPEFLAKNPNAKVPVLVDGELTLWESNAIMWYLAEGHGDTPLWSSDRRERAEIGKWQLWQAAQLSVAADGLLSERFGAIMGGPPADAERVGRYEAAFHRWADVLDGALESHDWLACDRFTCADIAVAAALMQQQLAQLPVEQHPATQAWLARVQQRDSWRSTEPPPMPSPSS